MTVDESGTSARTTESDAASEPASHESERGEDGAGSGQDGQQGGHVAHGEHDGYEEHDGFDAHDERDDDGPYGEDGTRDDAPYGDNSAHEDAPYDSDGGHEAAVEHGPYASHGELNGQQPEQHPVRRGNDDEDPSALHIEELILGSERQYTPFQAARAAGVSMELASRFWRAMGFADVGQARALTEADVLALRRLSGLVEAGLLSESMAVQVARSTGQTTARLADWQIDSFLMGLTEPPEPGMTRNEVTYPLVQLLLPELEEFLVYVWRRQLAAATGRVVQTADDEDTADRRQAIGFADLVGFTRLTRRLEDEELGELVEAFETTAADLVAANGGRLIKALGDEVLYVADDAGSAGEIGLRLIETMAHDETMPELRVGIAFGTMTTRMGDVFGNTVNLASRLTSIAPKDTVLVDGACRAELVSAGDSPESEKETEDLSGFRFALQPLYQRPVRGLGVVEPWMLNRR